MLSRLAIVLCLSLTLATHATAQFFPARKFSDKSDLDQMITNWYSAELSAMKEPSLWTLRNQTVRESYRFIWLRAFHPPYAFRLEIGSDGAGMLTAKSTVRSAHERPRLAMRKSRRLSPDQILQFAAGLDQLGFWTLPTTDRSRSGLDGSQWIFEGVKHGRYHVVDRWSPDDGLYRALMLQLVGFADIRVEPAY